MGCEREQGGGENYGVAYGGGRSFFPKELLRSNGRGKENFFVGVGEEREKGGETYWHGKLIFL